MQRIPAPKFLSHGIFAILILAGSGCATFNQPATTTAGFSVTALAPQTFRISYQGESSTPGERIVDLALLRACQLVKEREFSHFAVLDEASSSPGQVVYCAGLERVKPGRGLTIKCFSSRPKAIFSFKADDLQRVLEQKLNLNAIP